MATQVTTRNLRDAALFLWISGKNPAFFARRTSTDLAEIASKILGWDVSRARMCRALYANNILFRRKAGDVANTRRSRIDYVLNRLAEVETCLKRIEQLTLKRIEKRLKKLEK